MRLIGCPSAAVRASAPAVTGRYAEISLRLLRGQVRELGLDDRVDPAALAAVDALLGDGSDGVALRTDLAPRARRHLWLARRL